MDEAAGKACLRNAGLEVPDGRLTDGAGAGAAADELGYPVALKMIGAGLAHKTEAGAVALGLADRAAVDAAVARMRKDVETPDASAFLVERIIDQPIAELLVGIRSDPQFGHAMTIASGGVLVELIDDAVTVLLPASQSELAGALERLKLARLLDGFRGRPAADRRTVVDALDKLARYVSAHASQIAELEINPLFVLPDRVCAVDVLIQARAADQG